MSTWSTGLRNGFEYIVKYVRPILAILVVLLSFGFLLTLMYRPIPSVNIATINLALGFVLSAQSLVVGYYFATSKDKSDSDQSKIFPKEPPNP